MLKFQNISKTFHTLEGDWSLGPIDFEVETGEFVCILGTSGSGKSTLLHMAGGLTHPTLGEILVENKSLYKLSNKQLSIYRNQKFGFVFQDFYLLRDLNVFQNIALPLWIEGGLTENEINKQVELILERVGLTDLKMRFPRELSGGQKQRIAIARAFVHNPQIVFADEPTGNLDLKSAKQIIDLFLDLNKEQKTTIICVTHDENVAKKANRVIHLEEGKQILNFKNAT